MNKIPVHSQSSVERTGIHYLAH